MKSSFINSIFDQNTNSIVHFKLWKKPAFSQDPENCIKIGLMGKKSNKSSKISDRLFFLTSEGLFYKKSVSDNKIRGELGLRWSRVEIQELESPFGEYNFEMKIIKNLKFSKLYLKNLDDVEEWRQSLS